MLFRSRLKKGKLEKYFFEQRNRVLDRLAAAMDAAKRGKLGGPAANQGPLRTFRVERDDAGRMVAVAPPEQTELEKEPNTTGAPARAPWGLSIQMNPKPPSRTYQIERDDRGRMVAIREETETLTD